MNEDRGYNKKNNNNSTNMTTTQSSSSVDNSGIVSQQRRQYMTATTQQQQQQQRPPTTQPQHRTPYYPSEDNNDQGGGDQHQVFGHSSISDITDINYLNRSAFTFDGSELNYNEDNNRSSPPTSDELDISGRSGNSSPPSMKRVIPPTAIATTQSMSINDLDLSLKALDRLPSSRSRITSAPESSSIYDQSSPYLGTVAPGGGTIISGASVGDDRTVGSNISNYYGLKGRLNRLSGGPRRRGPESVGTKGTNHYSYMGTVMNNSSSGDNLNNSGMSLNNSGTSLNNSGTSLNNRSSTPDGMYGWQELNIDYNSQPQPPLPQPTPPPATREPIGIESTLKMYQWQEEKFNEEDEDMLDDSKYTWQEEEEDDDDDESYKERSINILDKSSRTSSPLSDPSLSGHGEDLNRAAVDILELDDAEDRIAMLMGVVHTKSQDGDAASTGKGKGWKPKRRVTDPSILGLEEGEGEGPDVDQQKKPQRRFSSFFIPGRRQSTGSMSTRKVDNKSKRRRISVNGSVIEGTAINSSQLSSTGEDSPNRQEPRFSAILNKSGTTDKVGSSDEEENSTSNDTNNKQRIRALVAYICRVPILLVLLLLLLSAVAGVIVVLVQPPDESDKGVASLEDDKSVLPTPSPTEVPLLDACVCYPFESTPSQGMLQQHNETFPWEEDMNTTTSDYHNIGGTYYKCLEEDDGSSSIMLSISPYLTICAFPHPNADPNLDGYHFTSSNSESIVESITVTATGELNITGFNEQGEGVTITSMGSFNVSNLDTASFNDTQIDEITEYFEDAINESIREELNLPIGSYIVNVTSIDENGVVQYEIVTYANSSIEGNEIATFIDTLLSQELVMTSIGNAVFISAQAASPDISSALEFISIDSHASSSTFESITTKVTTTGYLTIDGFNSSQLDNKQMEEAKYYFENAITQVLISQGLLSEGSYVEVTSLVNGIVEYEIHVYGQTNSVASTTITDIGLVLSNITTLTTVSSIIQTEAESAISSLSNITSAMNITGNTQTGTVGLIMTDVQLEEMKIIFADAISLALGSSLTIDTIVTVTSIINGVVSYEITTSVDSSENVSAAVTAIEAFMSNISTWDDITSYVEATVSSSIFDTITSGETLSITSNTAGTTTLIENTLANVVLNTLTMEIISISGNTLVVKDLLNTGFTTVQDSTGTTFIISHMNTPLIDLIPSDVIGLANEIEYCLSVPLEPSQLIRPTTGGDNNNTDHSGMFVRPGVKGAELQQQQDLSSYEEIVCLSLPLDSLLSLSTTDVLPPSGLQV